jgi:hypothetical protein
LEEQLKSPHPDWTEARFNSFVKSALRAASSRWPPRYEVLNEAYVGKKVNPKTSRIGKHFKCASCHNEFPASEVQVNHIESVVPIEGFKSWDDIIYRMFCPKDKLEVLCIPCHKLVTNKEKEARKQYKNNKGVV